MRCPYRPPGYHRTNRRDSAFREGDGESCPRVLRPRRDGSPPRFPLRLWLLASLHASLTARLDRLGGAKRDPPRSEPLSAANSRMNSCLPVRQLARGAAGNAARQANKSGIVPPGRPARCNLFFQTRPVQDAAYACCSRPRRHLHPARIETLESKSRRSCWRQARVDSPSQRGGRRYRKGWALGIRRGSGQRRESGFGQKPHNSSNVRFDLIATLPITPALRHHEIKLGRGSSLRSSIFAATRLP